MPGGEGEPIRILHVDDEPDVLEFAKTILEVEDLAFEIEDANTGDEVLKRLRSGYYDCLVSDYKMPGLDGIALAKEVRGFSEVPIILYTGQGSEEVASEAYSAGIDDYVRKEIDPSHFRVLAKRIRHVVEKRRSEQIYRGVFETARDPICIAHGSTIVYANKALAEMLGKPNPAELTGRDLFDWIIPEEQNAVRENLNSNSGNKALRIHEHTFITERGERRSVEVSSSTINYRGKAATLNIHRDITEKKRIEEDLVSSKKLLSMALDLTNTGSWVFDIKRRKVSWSEQVDRILGHQQPSGEIDLDMIQKFIPSAEWLRMVPKFWSVIDSGRFEDKFRITRADGGVRHVIANGEVERNDKGQIVRVLGSLQDITERTRYEEKLKAIYRHAIELSRASSINEVSDSALKAVKETLGFKTCSFHIVDGDVVMTIGSLGVKMTHPYVQKIDGVGVVPRAVRTGETQIIKDVAAEPDYEKGPFIGDQQMLSELTVPIYAGNRVAAVINLENPLRGAYGEDARVLMEALAATIGEALQRLSQLETLKSLNLHAVDIGHSKTIDEVAEATLRAISRMINFQTGSFSVIEGRIIKTIYGLGFSIDEDFIQSLDGSGVKVRCALTGKTQLIHDTSRDPDYIKGMEDEYPILLSELAVPIISGERVIGLINLESEEAGAFSDEDQEKVEILARYISAAIDLIREAKHHREAEEMYHGLLDSTMEGVVVVQDMKYAYVNSEYARILGYDNPSELIGVSVPDTVAPEYREIVVTRTIQRRSGKSPPSRYEVKLLKKDGTLIDAELNIALIEFNGAPASLTSVRDLTEQKWMEAEIKEHSTRLEQTLAERTKSLSESEAKYRTLVNNLHEGIWTMDAFGHTTFVNPRMAEMLGYEGSEMLGRHVTDFLAPEYINEYLNGIKRRKRGVAEQHDVELVKKNGELMMVSIGASPLFSEDGEYTGCLSGVVDVTDKVRLEAQLRESERQASVGRIASMVGHDLRTPLQTVKSAVALIRRKPKMAEDALHTIDEAVDYSTRILEDLRSVSGGVSPLVEPIDLEALITEATARCPCTKIDVDQNLSGGPVSIIVDPTMMSRVLDNLIKNASEAMPNGGSLRLVTGIRGEETIIEVHDTGVGIPAERIKELFQTFYTTKSNGLGLGLVYCKKAVEAHGGRIEVESTLGVGSMFRVCLPKECR